MSFHLPEGGRFFCPQGGNSGFAITTSANFLWLPRIQPHSKSSPPLVCRCRDWYPITPEEVQVATAITPMTVLKSRWSVPDNCPIHS